MRKITRRRLLACLLAVALLPVSGAAGYAQRRSLTYLYGGNTAIYKNNIARTRDSLTVVTPCYFGITLGGTLLMETTLDRAFLQEMRREGLQVVPYVGNHWNQASARAALADRSTFADAIANAVIAYDLDGIDIDIENITDKDRANFTDFIRILRAKLPTGKLLTVCVPANPNGWTTGWHGAYDYTQLARYCDYLFIMTYDESWQGGPAGPVASASFIERSIQYALTKTTKNKIMIGIPFYGRYWVQGKATGGAALTVSDIENLTARYSSTLWYDVGKESARATMTLTQADVRTGIWGGKSLSAGVYDIWYENDRSYKAKLALVRKYDLLGAGSWALGQEPARIWQHYRSWLSGLPFGDIEGHWAETHILRLYEEGLAEGSGGLYRPDWTLTRAEATALIFRLMGLSVSKEAVGQFTDLKGHWSEAVVERAAELGIIKGYGDGTFRPNVPISREEMAVMAARVLFVPDTIDFNQKVFPDVDPVTSWSNQAIITLYVNEILTGFPDGTFKPKQFIKRGEAAKIVSLIEKQPRKLPGESFAQTDEIVPDNGGVLEPR